MDGHGNEIIMMMTAHEKLSFPISNQLHLREREFCIALYSFNGKVGHEACLSSFLSSPHFNFYYI
jgi:hypothetical protein